MYIFTTSTVTVNVIINSGKSRNITNTFQTNDKLINLTRYRSFHLAINEKVHRKKKNKPVNIYIDERNYFNYLNIRIIYSTLPP